MNADDRDPIMQRMLAELRERQKDPMFDCLDRHLGRWTDNIDLSKEDYDAVIAYMDAFNDNQVRLESKEEDAFELFGIQEEQTELIRLIRNIYKKYSNKKRK